MAVTVQMCSECDRRRTTRPLPLMPSRDLEVGVAQRCQIQLSIPRLHLCVAPQISRLERPQIDPSPLRRAPGSSSDRCESGDTLLPAATLAVSVVPGRTPAAVKALRSGRATVGGRLPEGALDDRAAPESPSVDQSHPRRYWRVHPVVRVGPWERSGRPRSVADIARPMCTRWHAAGRRVSAHESADQVQFVGRRGVSESPVRRPSDHQPLPVDAERTISIDRNNTQVGTAAPTE